MDQYPYRDDTVGALGESILWLDSYRRFWNGTARPLMGLSRPRMR
jgi:hypothetical protein